MSNKILIVDMHRRFGGGQMHSLCKLKMLKENGFDAHILISSDKRFRNKLSELGLYFTKTNMRAFYFLKPAFKIALAIKLFFMCKKHKFEIVHCNSDYELGAARLVANFLPIKTVFTRHVVKRLKYKKIKNLDGFIGVNPAIIEQAKNLNDQHNLGIKKFEFIAPFFKEETFINFSTSQTRDEFFEKNFNLKLKNCPILCTVASLSLNKNQQILFKAMAYLIHTKKREVQAVLAGFGSQENSYKKMVKDLDIEQSVHFLGFTDKVADILYHSDIKVLPSRVGAEGFPISVIEASILKKPVIGTYGAGTDYAIRHEQTGLLFNPNDYLTLAAHIEKLIDNPDFAKQMAENAHKFVLENFTNQAKFEKLIKFYSDVINK